MSSDLYTWDREKSVGRVLCGVDEAGRGPLAGDVYAAAVVLDPERGEILGLNDSKKLSEKRREALYDRILASCLSYCVAKATVAEIEQYNILGAALLAMQRAIAGLQITPALVLIDGNRAPKVPLPTETVVHGDALSACIAAASILAKVSRDRAMIELDKRYPAYGFAKHKGYGTKAHYAAIFENGPCPAHRTRFLRNLAEHENN